MNYKHLLEKLKADVGTINFDKNDEVAESKLNFVVTYLYVLVLICSM